MRSSHLESVFLLVLISIMTTSVYGEDVSFKGEVVFYIDDGAPQQQRIANVTNNADMTAEAVCVWIQEAGKYQLPVKVKPETLVCQPKQTFGIFLILTEVDEVMIGNYRGTVQLTVTSMAGDVYTLPFYTQVEIVKSRLVTSSPFNRWWGPILIIASIVVAITTCFFIVEKKRKVLSAHDKA
jgi:hypothetical protein